MTSTLRAKLTRLIEHRVGLVLSSTTERRIDEFVTRRCEFLHTDRARYLASLEREELSDELQRLVNVVVVSKTAFFRCPAHVSAIVTELMPVLDRSLAPDRAIRIWSAACSSGEEPYSLAMALHDAGWLRRRRVRILASDIGTELLARARAAEYYLDAEARARLPAFAHKYFEPFSGHGAAKGVRVCEEIRGSVEFERINLNALSASDEYGWHVVLCCNVLIYFDESRRRRVIGDVQSLMAEQSALLFGGAEIALGSNPEFEVVRIGGCFAHLRGSWGELTRPEHPALPTPRTAQERLETEPPAAGGEAAAATGAVELHETSPTPFAVVSASSRMRAEILLDTMRYEEACRAFESSIEKDPFSSELHFLHGMALRALARHGEAEDAFRRAIFLDADQVLARYELGRTRHARGDFAHAVREYDRALRSLEKGAKNGRGERPLGTDEVGTSARFVEHLCRENRQRAMRGELPAGCETSTEPAVRPAPAPSVREQPTSKEHITCSTNRGGSC
jgi:chemotaxis methyl-accepting protein methylase